MEIIIIVLVFVSVAEAIALGATLMENRRLTRIVRENHSHLLNRMVAVTQAVIREHEKEVIRRREERIKTMPVNMTEVTATEMPL